MAQASNSTRGLPFKEWTARWLRFNYWGHFVNSHTLDAGQSSVANGRQTRQELKRAVRGPASNPTRIAVVVGLIGLLVTASVSWTALVLDRHNEQRLLEVQTRQAAAVIASTILDISDPLSTALRVGPSTYEATSMHVPPGWAFLAFTDRCGIPDHLGRGSTQSGPRTVPSQKSPAVSFAEPQETRAIEWRGRSGGTSPLDAERTGDIAMDASPDLFAATLERVDGNSIVVLVGELDLDTAPELAGVLEPLLDDGPSEVFVECSDLSFIDSSGIAVLVAAQMRLKGRGAHLALRSLTPNAMKIFATVGLTEFLNVEPADPRSLA